MNQLEFGNYGHVDFGEKVRDCAFSKFINYGTAKLHVNGKVKAKQFLNEETLGLKDIVPTGNQIKINSKTLENSVGFVVLNPIKLKGKSFKNVGEFFVNASIVGRTYELVEKKQKIV